MNGSVSVVVATHGHCFDGMASAVVFTQLMKKLSPGRVFSFTYRTCDYGPRWNGVPPEWMHADENAILDYRYSALPKLTWYFDHHRTAFHSPEDLDHFQSRPAHQKYHDPDYSSCTKLIVDVAKSEFGIRFDELDELVRWADQIDAARFDDPGVILARSDAALQLMSVLFHHGDDVLLTSLVPLLSQRTLNEVVALESIQSLYQPLKTKHEHNIELMRAHSDQRGAVAVCDLSAVAAESLEKFAMYAFFPKATYSVILSRSDKQVRLSIGFNPWSGNTRTHDISAICKRYGGGGHPVVGAFSLPPDQLEKAKTLLGVLVDELNS